MRMFYFISGIVLGNDKLRTELCKDVKKFADKLGEIIDKQIIKTSKHKTEIVEVVNDTRRN